MKINSALILLATLFLLNSCEDKTTSVDTLISNVTIIDAVNQTQVEKDLAIRNNKILEISNTGSKNYITQNNIDGTGKFLIPGLWDAHVHLAYDTLLSESMLPTFIKYGVTSIRDTGGDIDKQEYWKKIASENQNTNPSVYISGPLIDGTPVIYDGSSTMARKLGVGSDDPNEIAKIATSLADRGVDFLKAYELLSPESFQELTKVAKEKNLKLTGHIPLSIDLIQAIDLGLNSIEHLRNIEMSCAGNWEELLEQRKSLLHNKDGLSGLALRANIHTAQRKVAVENQTEERTQIVLDKLKEKQVWQIPTLTIMTAGVKRPWTKQDWQASYENVPDTVANRWTAAIKGMIETPIDSAKVIYSNWLTQMVGEMNNHDIKILAGTDCPIYFLTPGFTLHYELELLVEAGLTPMEALESATINPALYFGIENEYGSIEKNKYADLILLDKNPLENIKNTITINKVFKHGNLVIDNQ